MKEHLVVVALFLFSLLAGPVAAQGQAEIEYISPRPGARLVSPGTTIAIRLGESVREESLHAALFAVVGEKSGVHKGTVILADDQETMIFRPEQPFAPGENVRVTIGRGITATSDRVFAGMSLGFVISPRDLAASPPMAALAAEGEGPAMAEPQAGSTGWLTLPKDAPVLTITAPADETAGGYMFLTPSVRGGGYLLIADDAGEPVYYQRLTGQVLDLKKQPNGLLTYHQDGCFYGLDNSYYLVDTWRPGNGYPKADPHDLQLLPNGHALLHIYDQQPYDMSQIVPGGYPTATVAGLVIQELDTAKNVVFEWRSWDHFLITDTYASLTQPEVDYVHANALELDYDGNILVSSRHLSEITKIDRRTGDIIWRLGGKNNQFTFVNDTAPYFHYQHDIRRLPNGHITLFDNHNGLASPNYSRPVEYALDEGAKTATLVWEYKNTPLTYGSFMGNVQRLSNGNTVIGWGGAGMVTEVKPDGSKALEFALPQGSLTYRGFRFPWHGYPTTQPTLVVQLGSDSATLTTSWNGATDIGAYHVYAGDQPHPMTLVATQPKTGFETHIVLPYTPGRCSYYRVMPIDSNGWETRYSNEVSISDLVYLPAVAK